MSDKLGTDVALKDAISIAAALLESAPDSAYLEVRVILSAGSVVQRFFSVRVVKGKGDWAHHVEEFDGRGNVYYDVVPRKHHRGTAEACGPASATWSDFDSGAPRALPVAPSVVVETSPAKFQALWLLETPCEDLDRVESINRAIAAHHGGDGNACDRARVLRLPGFQNLKYYTRPYARVVVCRTDQRFSIGDLEEAFPAVRVTASASSSKRGQYPEAPTWLTLVFEAINDFLATGGFAPQPSGNAGVLARCPLHEDHHPSLSLHPVRGWKCWAGCGQGRLTKLASRLGVSVGGLGEQG